MILVILMNLELMDGIDDDSSNEEPPIELENATYRFLRCFVTQGVQSK